MNTRLKKIIKSFIPPIFLKSRQSPDNRNQYGYFGNFSSWRKAREITNGYDSKTIIEKVRASALKVKTGQAIYERDSVIFDKIDVSWPLLTTLLFVASQYNNKLRIIDFGGALGTSYFQNRKFLEHIEVSWNIIEQKAFVDIGKAEFEGNQLNFYEENDMNEVAKTIIPNLLIVSSSLQFLENPSEFIEKTLKMNFPFIVFDKIPFSTNISDGDRLMIQKVPPKIYDASYPVWIFGENEFLKKMAGYVLIGDFDAYNGHVEEIENGKMHYRGFIFKKL